MTLGQLYKFTVIEELDFSFNAASPLGSYGMLMVMTGRASQLPQGLEVALATYRHRVFVEALGWQLPGENGLERDQFDREDTFYAVARDIDGRVCGCARLLPTTKAYLLDEIFPELMNGYPAPHASNIWELSRFSTMPISESSPISREEARTRFRKLFVAIINIATTHGIDKLITVTTVGVERILRSIGIHAHRVGPPHFIDGKPTLAIWIELDLKTRHAVHLPAQHLASEMQSVFEEPPTSLRPDSDERISEYSSKWLCTSFDDDV